jgi:hypothetical protein
MPRAWPGGATCRPGPPRGPRPRPRRGRACGWSPRGAPPRWPSRSSSRRPQGSRASPVRQDVPLDRAGAARAPGGEAPGPAPARPHAADDAHLMSLPHTPPMSIARTGRMGRRRDDIAVGWSTTALPSHGHRHALCLIPISSRTPGGSVRRRRARGRQPRMPPSATARERPADPAVMRTAPEASCRLRHTTSRYPCHL